MYCITWLSSNCSQHLNGSDQELLMDLLLLQIDVLFSIWVFLLRVLHFTNVPWVHFTTAECIQMSALNWQTSAQLSRQHNQPHLMGFYCCAVPQLSHIIPHPPTQTVIAGCISIRIATTFDVLVRYS